MDLRFPIGIMASSSAPNATTSSGVTIDQPEKKPSTTLRRANSRRRFWRLRRKKKLPTVTLGGGQRQLQGGASGSRSVMMRMIRRMRIRWLKLKKAWVLKKLKEYYLCVLKDLITEPHESLQKHQQMLVKETSFAVPVMGLSFNAFR